MKFQQILTDAIYESVQDRAFQPVVNGGYLLAALNFLNLVLDEWRDLIPYPSRMIFSNVDNLEATVFVEIDQVGFIINKSVSILTSNGLREFRQKQDVEDLKGFPSDYYFDQLNQTIEVYPKPSMPAYKFQVDGRVSAAAFGEFDDVPKTITPFMRSALTYEIAFRLSAYYGKDWDAKKETLRTNLLSSLKNKKNIDLSTAPTCDLGMPTSGQAPPLTGWYYISGGRS